MNCTPKRAGKTQTLFGEVVLKRAYYLCEQCHQGQHPLDKQLEFCAGGVSGGLYELMALMGAEFVFEEAASMLEMLTLVQVSANSCLKAAESLGTLVAEDEQKTRLKSRRWNQTIALHSFSPRSYLRKAA